MNPIVPVHLTDRECLDQWRRKPGSESLRPLVERYGGVVYSTASRRTSSADHAAEATLAVFLVLARRARRLRKKTVVADWLFQVTAVVCKKLAPSQPTNWLRRFRKETINVAASDSSLWQRLAPEIDSALGRLP